MRSTTKTAAGFAVPFLAAGLLGAAEPASPAAKEVESLLRKLNDAFVKKDVETMKLLMSKDHVGILNRGQRMTGAEQRNSLGDLHLTEYTEHDVQFTMPAKDQVIVTYQANQKGTWKGRALPSPIMVSAVWANRNGKWQEVLYQETPVRSK